MKLTYITLRGEQHPLCYNLYAIEELCDEFGGLDKMADAMNSDSQAEQIRAIGTVLRILMDGGREYCREMGIELPKPIKNPTALIDASSPETITAIFSAIQTDKKQEVEVKNAVTTQDN